MKTKTKVNVVMFGNEGEREREQSGTFFFSSLAIRDILFMQLRWGIVGATSLFILESKLYVLIEKEIRLVLNVCWSAVYFLKDSNPC